MWQSTRWEPASQVARKAPVAAEQAQLARLRREVDARWRTLALAHERATALAPAALERLYDAYMRAVDAYVARQRALTRSYDAQQRAS
jgi:hypothetical protein